MSLARLLLCGARQLDPPDNTATPFRLLNLPPEIRLIVYKQLAIDWVQTRVPMDKTQTQWITMVNPSLPGVRILATCRLINKEASPIIQVQLARMLEVPPTLIIDIRDITGIVSMRSCLFHRRTFVDKLILQSSRPSTIRKIQEYRSGKRSLVTLHFDLYLFESLSPETTRAIATFILRIAHFKTTNFETPNRFPPITIAISVPSTFFTMPVTLTSSLPVRLLCKYMMHQPRSRSRTVQAGMFTLTRRFASEVSALCDIWKHLSVYLMLHLPSSVEMYPSATQLEVDFSMAVHQGLQRWINDVDGPPMAYAGVYREAADGGPMGCPKSAGERK